MNKDTKWENISFVISSSYRKKVLMNFDKPKTPSIISKELKINKTHISRSLSELMSRGLIICLTPKIHKGKFYTISENGKIILKEIKENC